MDTICVDKFGGVPIDDVVESSPIEVDCGKRVDCQNPDKDVEKLKAPYVGMLFESSEEAKKYYDDYGRQEGFWIRIRNTSKSRRGSDEVTGITYVCSHQGKFISKSVTVGNETLKKTSRSCSIVKCGCKASMRIVNDKWTTKWKVSVFNNDHNHKVVTPTRRIKMRTNRSMAKATKDLVETFQRENMQVDSVRTILGGDLIDLEDSDCYNHLRDVRHRKLEGGDAQSVLNYFRKRQAENPQFFYAIQCDEEGRTTNFFWVDARSRLAYQYFGDVVLFDTTYRINKYDIPFAPFTGVNHHFQSIQFGCAFLQDETYLSFLWLFETWLEAMGGRHPTLIITNQDLAMRNAIVKVFPNTRHCLSIWHIEKNLVKKLSQIYYKNSEFKSKIKKCIWSTYIREEFEKQWNTIIMENGLEQNEWVRQLFEIRESWVPVYNHNTFFAGMNTSECRKNINGFFDDFVTSTTNLREFVVKYEEALKKTAKDESDEDFHSEHTYRCVNDDEFLLKHAAKVYTRNLFEKFKEEWLKVKRYKIEEGGIDDGYHVYIVKTKIGEPEEFLVKLNLDSYKGTCECKKFEFFGILCRHFLKVFFRRDIDSIPFHFILGRWRQEANKFRVMDSQIMSDGKEQSEALRFNNICQQATKLACIAASSINGYTLFMDNLNELSKKLCEVQPDVMSDPVGLDLLPKRMRK